jgi:predicted CXXCH cytochrome family protein
LSKKKKRREKPLARTGAGYAGTRAQTTAASQDSRRKVPILAWLLPIIVVAVVAVAIGMRLKSPTVPGVIAQNRPILPIAKFMGSARCATCHEHESRLWMGSHHQRAMQPASQFTVLGDFNDASFINGGITSTFFRKDSRFMVRTDGPDGALHDYEIKYTFGVYPLQQYLIAMPGGRLQALGIAWDSRPRENGGQHWYFLYPGERIAPSDRLHWTSIDQTWNYQCADCHSTNLRKNYDLQTRNYSTTYAEINVACEACHGPGSNHAAWAKKQNGWKKFEGDHGLTIVLNERDGIAWSINPATGNPERSSPRISEREIQMCARCHSRRGEIHENYVHGQPVGDDYRVALLDHDLYFPDGQIKGEVYEYGSFIQSRMFHAGVTCSDCHEPHSLELRADGNNVCLQCHSATKYDSSKHHFHQMGSAGARCVECHMPTRTYMVVDERRDHSIRIPRPDLSIKLGTPNACNNCHTDKSAVWASYAIDKWYGHAPEGFQRFAEIIDAGVAGAPGGQQSLAGLAADREQPAIARATALSMLANYSPGPGDESVRGGVKDDSSLVRRAVPAALSNSDPSATGSVLESLTRDPVLSVRIETAEVLASAPTSTIAPEVTASLAHATDEYIAAQQLNADRPEAHLNLGLLYSKQARFDEAENEFKTALSLDPTFAPAAVDLADLYREQTRDQAGESVLEDAIVRSPEDASLRESLGLLMVRQKQGQKALELFADAARLNPSNARYAYVYAIALNGSGQTNAAIEKLEGNVKAHPYDRDSLSALANFYDQAGKFEEALTYAQRLAELDPEDLEVQQMIKALNTKIQR